MFFVPGHSVQNLASTVPVDKPEVGLVGLDSALQEQERIITMSYTLASEASLKSKLVAGRSFISSEKILCVFRSRGCCWFIHLCFEKGCKSHFSPLQKENTHVIAISVKTGTGARVNFSPGIKFTSFGWRRDNREGGGVLV